MASPATRGSHIGYVPMPLRGVLSGMRGIYTSGYARLAHRLCSHAAMRHIAIRYALICATRMQHIVHGVNKY